MIQPEDTTEVFSQEEGLDYSPAHNLPLCIGFIKGIFWVIVAILVPLVLPVLFRAIGVTPTFV